MKITPDSLGNLINEITIRNSLELMLYQVCENSPYAAQFLVSNYHS